MSGRMSALCALFLLLALVPIASAQDTPVAVLMAPRGDVFIARGGERLAGEFGMHLGVGDEIRTGEQSHADILYATGQILQLAANGSLVLGDEVTGDGEQSVSFASVDRLLKLRESRGTSAIGRVRGGRSAEVIAVSPRASTRIRADHPVFRWSGGQGANEFDITIEQDGAALWSSTVKDATKLEYPAAAPALAPGASYAWRVRAVDPLALSPAESQTAFFATLSSAEAAEVDARVESIAQLDVSDVTRAVMIAGVLFQTGLVDEAVESLDRAIDSGVDDDGLLMVRENLRGAFWP